MEKKYTEIYDLYETPNGNLFIKLTNDYSIAIGSKGKHNPTSFDRSQYVDNQTSVKVKKVGKLVFY